MSDFLNDMQCDELVDGQYFDGQYVPTEQDLVDMNSESPADENFFCGNCGEELVDDAQSPDKSLCCDCYKYNRFYAGKDNDNDDYIETESDVYQDSSYDN